MTALSGATAEASDPETPTPAPVTGNAAKKAVFRISPARIALPAACGVVSLAFALATRDTPGQDVKTLAQSLSAATGAIVVPEDIRWEPSRGTLTDAISGRDVLFLARPKENAPRDVYRARVRVSPEGHPIEIASVHDLTQTEIGDDAELIANGNHAAFTTYAFGRAQSVTMLDTAGEGDQNLAEKTLDRMTSFVTNVQQTGSGEGIARYDVTIDQPAKYVGLHLDKDALLVSLSDDSPQSLRTARLDAKGELATSSPGLHAQPARHLPKRPIFWAVDTVRAVPWIGPAPIAWLEEKTFGIRTILHDAALHATSKKEDFELAAPPEKVTAGVLDNSETESDTDHWPPKNIRSIWKNPQPGEGEWSVPKMPWLKRLPTSPGSPEAPSAFYTAFVRPDEERPDAKVLLVAMDMRQLDLDMEAGSEDPKPLTGPPGSGRIPRDPKVYTRVAAAMNGGFKTEHGFYGMMVKKRVLLPPQPGAASMVVLKDGRIGLGSWGNTKEIGGLQDIADSDIISFRQNLDPLVDNDKINPMGRWMWGFTLPGTSMQTERTGICVNAAGHLIYGWAEEVSGPTLGKGLRMAGCVYGMHLDMNPHHTGFIFANVTELKGRNFKSELLTDKMGIAPDRYIEYAPKDFFFMLMHDPTPDVSGFTWTRDEGMQPAPAWMPAIFRADAGGGNGGVTLTTIDRDRASFRIRAGKSEPDNKTGQRGTSELGDDDAHRVLFALGAGTSKEKTPLGLVTDGKTALKMTGNDAHAALVASPEGQLSIMSTIDDKITGAHTDAVELPLLLDGDKTFPAHGARAALGLAKDGRVFVAQGESSGLADALKRAGCTKAVALTRGAEDEPLFARAGTQNSPRAFYDETVIYGLSVPMKPRGFRFDPINPVPLPKEKKAQTP
jgi:hypothetical protein